MNRKIIIGAILILLGILILSAGLTPNCGYALIACINATDGTPCPKPDYYCPFMFEDFIPYLIISLVLLVIGIDLIMTEVRKKRK